MFVLLSCSTRMFKALLFLPVLMTCFYLHRLLMNIMLYVTHTPLNMYLLLFGFSVNTQY